MPPRRRRHGGQRQSSSPPPPPMPPGRHRGGDQRQRSPPSPPPMTPGRRTRNDRQQLTPSPPRTRTMPPEPRRFLLLSWRHELRETAKLEESSITNASSSSPSSVDDSDSRSAQEDRPARLQTVTPNSGSDKEQYIQDLLNKAVADNKLDLAQRRKELEESSITNAYSSSLPQPTPSKELLDTTRPVESSITSASTSSLPQSPSCEVPNTSELELKRTPSLSSCVSSLSPSGLLIKYFVRVDKGGFFHTYPNRGGPFKNLQEAQEAIDSYHVVERNNMCMDGLSSQERAVRKALYWYHDGTRKNSAEAFAAMSTYCPERDVVKALLDKYNEESINSGDPSYELKDIVSYEPCFDGKGSEYRSFSHFNMTVKTKGDDDSTCANNKLFFAEVTCVIDEHEEYLLTCFCTVQHDDKGSCNVCGDEMKHPFNAEYKHGRPRSPIRRYCSYVDADDLYAEFVTVRDEAWLKAKEARVRRMVKEAEEAFKKNNKKFQARVQPDVRRRFNQVEALEKDNKYVVPARRQKKVQPSGGGYQGYK